MLWQAVSSRQHLPVRISLLGYVAGFTVWYDVLDTPMYTGTILRLYIDYINLQDHAVNVEMLLLYRVEVTSIIKFPPTSWV